MQRLSADIIEDMDAGGVTRYGASAPAATSDDEGDVAMDMSTSSSAPDLSRLTLQPEVASASSAAAAAPLPAAPLPAAAVPVPVGVIVRSAGMKRLLDELAGYRGDSLPIRL
jgi:hypothetical protein